MKTSAAPSSAAETPAASGPGACCAEAQADGVPCTEIRDCELCGRAHPFAVVPTRPVPALQS